jgi:hypothetical protein
MNYEIVKTGDVIFLHKEQTFTSKIIKFCTNSDLVHVGIAYWKDGNLYIIESQYLKDRRMVILDVYENRYKEVISSKIALNNLEELVKTLGIMKYGYKDLILTGIKGILSRIGFKVKFRNYEGEICSEMVATILNYKPSNISPIELYERLLKDRNNIKAIGY